MTRLFEDNFEGCDLAKWTKDGTPTCSTDKNHTPGGSYSCKFLSTLAVQRISKTFASQQSGLVVVFWLYDDATLTDPDKSCVVLADDSTTTCFMGVSVDKPSSYYIYRIGSTYYVTGIARSTGWHKMKFDYSDGLRCKGSIDGTQIFDVDDPDTFNRFIAGNSWAKGDAIDYVDDVYTAPEALTQEVSDILGMADSVPTKASFKQSVSELLGMADSVPGRADFKQAVSEAIGLVDSAACSRGVPITISDILGLRDSIERRKKVSKVPDLPDHTIEGGAAYE